MQNNTNKKLVFITLINANLSFKGEEGEKLRLAPSKKYYAVLQYVTKSKDAKDIVAYRHLFRTSRKEPSNIGRNIITWDHKYRPFHYSGPGDKVKIRIHLYDGSEKADVSNLMGMAQLSVFDDLINGKDLDGNQPVKFDLKSETGDISGAISLKCSISTAQAQQNIFISHKSVTNELNNITTVNPNMFVTPVHRIGVSGGTAAFYKLKYQKPDSFRHEQYLLKSSVDYYIGKDLLHAVDEVEFYEEILKIKSRLQENDRRIVNSFLPELMNFALEYIGILTAPEATGTDDNNNASEVKHLLILRNLYDRCKKLRLLDFKIGYYTASSGWKKKSALRAAKQLILDSMTNSMVEGYRLEGFDGSPMSLKTREETLGEELEFVEFKKARRLMYQNLSGCQSFVYLMDLHSSFKKNYKIDDYFTPEEVMEIVLHEIVKRLSSLAVTCCKVTIPQKWVGSSVALGFDSGYFPKREKDFEDSASSVSKLTSEDRIRSKVIVNIFDWGRSELNTPEKHDQLKSEEKTDREEFWKYYVDGITHLSLVATNAYLNRFGNCTEWASLHLTIKDFDPLTKDDFLGCIRVPLEPTPLKEHKVEKGRATRLYYSIEWQSYPKSSRFKGAWKVFIQKATNLRIADILTSDPYCIITAVSDDRKHCFDQTTNIVPNTLDPVWEEYFEIPIMKSGNNLELALKESNIEYSNTLKSELLSDKWLSKHVPLNNNLDASCVKQWSASINTASQKAQ